MLTVLYSDRPRVVWEKHNETIMFELSSVTTLSIFSDDDIDVISVLIFILRSSQVPISSVPQS